MRTKTAVLGAAAVAAGALSSMAQNVYSVNVVGYVNVVIPNGFTLIENPLNAPDNSLNALFAYNTTNLGSPGSPADGDLVYYFASGAFHIDQNDPYGSGFGNNVVMPPGTGFFVSHSGPAYTNTFVGTVMQGSLTNLLPAGFSLVGSQVPQAGFTASLGLTAGPSAGQGDIIYLFNGTSFVICQNDPYGTGWPATPGFTVDPTNGPFINVAQSFFYNNQGGGSPLATWVRNFTVQ